MEHYKKDDKNMQEINMQMFEQRKELDAVKKLNNNLSMEKNELWHQNSILGDKCKKAQRVLEKNRLEKMDFENLIKDRELVINQISSELEAHKMELKKIHSERDTVLKENQKCLKEELRSAYSKCESPKLNGSWIADIAGIKEKYVEIKRQQPASPNSIQLGISSSNNYPSQYTSIYTPKSGIFSHYPHHPHSI